MENNNEKNFLEKNKLFKNFLEKHFFYDFRDNKGLIEFFIKSQCPKNCAYCYLKKHGKELYPYELQSDENILKNIELLCNWYKENQFTAPIEIFSGEIITNGLLFKVLDKMYNVFSEEFLIYKPSDIIIPENGDFLEDIELTKKVNQYIKKFKEIDITIFFSLSVDGKYMDKNRTTRNDEYYKRAINFCNENVFAFHPMISAFNIDKWIDNYDWWNSEEVVPAISDHMMTLEVRDNNWTEEKISEYLKFIDHVIVKEFEKCFNDPDLFTQRLIGVDYYPEKGYYLIGYNQNSSNEKDYKRHGLTCGITHTLHIRVGDLNIIPCHRLSYEQFIVGQMIVKDNKILDYEVKNLEILTSILSWSSTNGPKCGNCEIRHWCLGPCLGSNFENSGNLFMPPDSVCQLFKAKFIFQMMKFQELGLFPYFEKYLPEDQYKTLMEYAEIINRKFENYGQYYHDKIDDCKKQGLPLTELRI